MIKIVRRLVVLGVNEEEEARGRKSRRRVLQQQPRQEAIAS